MRQGGKVLQSIHKQLDVTNVEDTMEDIREQMEITQQIANAISDPVNAGLENLDEVRELPEFGLECIHLADVSLLCVGRIEC